MGRPEVIRKGSVYFIRFDDGSKAWLAVKEEGDKMYLLETYTPEQHRGKGYARLLMETVIKDAREKGLKLIPICSYSVYYFVRFKNYRDVLAEPYRSMSYEELKKHFEERLAEERSKK